MRSRQHRAPAIAAILDADDHAPRNAPSPSQVIRSTRETAERLASFSQSIVSASNIAVNFDPGTTHGTLACFTPCFGHFIRGTSAVSSVRNCIVSRCRHVRVRESYPLQSAPHIGHARPALFSYAMKISSTRSSSRVSTSFTYQGLLIPSSFVYKSRSRTSNVYTYARSRPNPISCGYLRGLSELS